MSKLYGRDHEFSRLKAIWQQVREQRTAHVVTYLGESGVGKSRLVQELYHWLTRHCDAHDYWPDAFLDADANLQVTPVFPPQYVPGGPPQYLWLGTRWRDPHERNSVDHSALPTLHAQLARHAQLVHAHGADWKTRLQQSFVDVAERRVSGDLLGIIADQLVPFSSLAISFISDVVEQARPGALTHDEARQAQELELDQQVQLLLRKLMSGSHPLPCVLWLDDVHWIDEQGMRFVRDIKREATKCRWPLVMIATAWPLEWSQRKLDALFGEEHTRLDSIDECALRMLLLDDLRGLTESQADLLITKAGGNVLTLRENIADLRRYPAYFVSSDTSCALSAQGEQRVQEWSNNRQQRVEERFISFNKEIREFLARASVLGVGTRFLIDVVRQYAAIRGILNIDHLLKQSVNVYAMITPVDQALYEFRDYGYFKAAQHYFRVHLNQHEYQLLASALDHQLDRWINSAWQDDGELYSPSTAPVESLLHLSDNEQMAIVTLAIERASNSIARVVSMRARVYAILRHAANSQWNVVRSLVAQLAHNWSDVAASDIGWVVREQLAAQCIVIRRYDLARALIDTIVANRNIHYTHNSSDDQSLIAVIEAQYQLSRVYYAEKRFDEALVHAITAYQQYRPFVEQHSTIENNHRCSVIMQFIGRIVRASGYHAEAHRVFLETLEMRYRVQKSIDTQTHEATIIVDVIHGIATTLAYLGRTSATQQQYLDAERYYRQSIHNFEQVIPKRSRIDDLFHLSTIYSDLGAIYSRLHDQPRALEAYTHDLSLMQHVVDRRGLPDDYRALAEAQRQVGILTWHSHQRVAAQRLFIDASTTARHVAVMSAQYDDLEWFANITSDTIEWLVVVGALPAALSCLTAAIQLCQTAIADATPDTTTPLTRLLAQLLTTSATTLASATAHAPAPD